MSKVTFFWLYAIHYIYCGVIAYLKSVKIFYIRQPPPQYLLKVGAFVTYLLQPKPFAAMPQ